MDTEEAAVAYASCRVPGCPNPAGPEGYCESHEDLAKVAREATMVSLQMQRQTEAMDALRAAAHKVVMAEKRETWHRATKAKRKARKAKAQSRSRNR